MDVSKNSGTPKSSILIGFSIIFTIHFGVPLFLETTICWSLPPPNSIDSIVGLRPEILSDGEELLMRFLNMPKASSGEELWRSRDQGMPKRMVEKGWCRLIEKQVDSIWIWLNMIEIALI